MFDDEILDKELLKDLLSDIPGLTFSDSQETEKIGEDEETLILKTFLNNHQAYAYKSVMNQAGIPAFIEVDRTLGNMDPLFNTGTALLRVREKDTKQAVQVLDALDRLFEQEKRENGKMESSGGIGSTIFKLVLTFGAFLLLILLLTGPQGC